MAIEFNTGFITAIGLFIQHKYMKNVIINDHDLRLYGATDHLYDMEIPSSLPKKLQRKITKAREKAFELRLGGKKGYNTVKETEALFNKFENILAEIDETIFKTEKVIMKYR